MTTRTRSITGKSDRVPFPWGPTDMRSVPYIPYDEDEIERKNKTCYDAIAHEYDHPSHATLRDLEEANRLFIDDAKRLLTISHGGLYLDIGVGTASSLMFLSDVIREKDLRVELLDISREMVGVALRKVRRAGMERYIRQVHVQSVFKFYTRTKYDLIVSTLADPFLIGRLVRKVSTLLKGGGMFLLTLPAYEWARNSDRSHIHVIRYRTLTGQIFESFSFCWPVRDIIELADESDFFLRLAQNIFLYDVLKKKKVMSQLNNRILYMHGNIPFLLGMLLVKKREGSTEHLTQQGRLDSESIPEDHPVEHTGLFNTK